MHQAGRTHATWRLGVDRLAHLRGAAALSSELGELDRTAVAIPANPLCRTTCPVLASFGPSFVAEAQARGRRARGQRTRPARRRDTIRSGRKALVGRGARASATKRLRDDGALAAGEQGQPLGCTGLNSALAAGREPAGSARLSMPVAPAGHEKQKGVFQPLAD